jgi:hypothetical protein
MTTEQGIADDQRARYKRAELAGGVGAGALGMGLGVVLAPYLRRAGLLLISVGAALHAIGMWDKHRLEQSVGGQPLWWEAALYWLCWAMLGGIVLYVLLR